VIAIIETDEGVRLTAQVIDVAPDEVKIGMRVRRSSASSVRRAPPA